jgi:hypothetical protein
MGLATASMSVLTLSSTAAEDHAVASSSLQLADVLGSVLGIAGAALIRACLAAVAALVIPAGLRIRG